MKSFLCFSISLYLFATCVFAQNPPPPAAPKPPVVIKGSGDRPPPPPPPAPLIYSAPDKSSIGKFSSDRFGFTVDFPGKPEIAESKADGANVNTFRAKLKGSNEIVEISDYDFNVEQKLNKNEIFEQIKRKYLSGETSELISEKDVEQDGVSGREFSFDLKYELNKVRVFVKNGRIYELVATVTNWHILKDNVKDKAQAFNDEADRFFASFRINAPAPAIVADKNFDGKIELFKSKSNIYEAEDGSFRVFIPGKPKYEKKTMPTAFGETELNLVTLQTVMAFYGVTYFDYPAAVSDPSEIRFISDEQRDAILKKNFTLVSEKDISYRGNYGREYVMTTDGNTVVMRNFFAGQRLFRLLVITNGALSKIPEPFAGEYKNAAYRFLDSLEVNKIPPPEFGELKMPEDFGLRTENSIVYSDFFGFSMNAPEGWNILNRQQSDLVKEYAYRSLQDKDELTRSVAEESLSKTRILFAVTSPQKAGEKASANLIVGAEKMTLPRFQPEAIASLYIRELLDKNEELVGGINKTKIDGVDFAWFETVRKDAGTKQRIYYSNQKNLAFIIVLTYIKDEDLKTLSEKLNTVRFKK